MSVKFKGKNITGVYIKNKEIVKAMFRNKVVYEKESPEPPVGDEFTLNMANYTLSELYDNIQIGGSDVDNLKLGYKQLLTLKEYKLKVEVASGVSLTDISVPFGRLFNGVFYQYRTLEGSTVNETDTSLFDGAWHTMSKDLLYMINAFTSSEQSVSIDYKNYTMAQDSSYSDVKVTNVELGTANSGNGVIYTIKKYNATTGNYTDDFCVISTKDIKFKKETVVGTLYGLADDSLTFDSTNATMGSNYKGVCGVLPVLSEADSTKGSTAICEWDLTVESGYTNSNATPISLTYKKASTGALTGNRQLKKNNASPKKGIVLVPSTIGTDKSAFGLMIGKYFKAGSTTLNMTQLELEWDATLKQLKVYDIRSSRVLAGTFTITSLKIFVW